MGASDKLASMKPNTITTGSLQFLREYPRFEQFVVRGGKVSITDVAGHRFVFMLASGKRHPPRQAEGGLDPKAFAGLDLDEPALPPAAWGANQ